MSFINEGVVDAAALAESTVPEATDVIEACESVDVLAAIEVAENAGKVRAGIFRAIDAQLVVLQGVDDEAEAEAEAEPKAKAGSKAGSKAKAGSKPTETDGQAAQVGYGHLIDAEPSDAPSYRTHIAGDLDAQVGALKRAAVARGRNAGASGDPKVVAIERGQHPGYFYVTVELS